MPPVCAEDSDDSSSDADDGHDTFAVVQTSSESDGEMELDRDGTQLGAATLHVGPAIDSQAEWARLLMALGSDGEESDEEAYEEDDCGESDSSDEDDGPDDPEVAMEELQQGYREFCCLLQL
eukprot:SAG11_NODE_434_length_9506_cov_5.089295_6_plen_122_part_00